MTLRDEFYSLVSATPGALTDASDGTSRPASDGQGPTGGSAQPADATQGVAGGASQSGQGCQDVAGGAFQSGQGSQGAAEASDGAAGQGTLAPGVTATFRIRLLTDSVIYRAHFPGEPITPGACLVQIVEELASLWAGAPWSIGRVANLKFLHIIRPDATPEADVRIGVQRLEGDHMTLKGDIAAAGTTCVRFTLGLDRASGTPAAPSSAAGAAPDASARPHPAQP